MRRYSARLCALIAGAALLTSCLNDDDDNVSTYADTAITQFTLGTLNRYTHTTSTKTGNDTIVKSTLTGSNYKMAIDQLSRRIYNTTALPVGTDAAHVICTVSTKNGGVVALKAVDSDSLRWHASTDSVDLTQPRVFRVYASDGTDYRDYSVELNVSSTTGITFQWQLETTEETLADWTGKRLTSKGDSVRLVDIDSIIGASSYEQYAIGADGLLRCSRDGGVSWQNEQLDDDVTLLPAAKGATLVSWPYTPADNTDYVLLVGTPRQDGEETMRVWRKICPADGSGQWVYMPFDDSNVYQLPRLEGLTMAYYEGTVLAVGSDMVMRQSRDQGISWHKTSTYALPSTLTGTAVTMAADTKGRLWLLTNTGQLWMGALR